MNAYYPGNYSSLDTSFINAQLSSLNPSKRYMKMPVDKLLHKRAVRKYPTGYNRRVYRVPSSMLLTKIESDLKVYSLDSSKIQTVSPRGVSNFSDLKQVNSNLTVKGFSEFVRDYAIGGQIH